MCLLCKLYLYNFLLSVIYGEAFAIALACNSTFFNGETYNFSHELTFVIINPFIAVPVLVLSMLVALITTPFTYYCWGKWGNKRSFYIHLIPLIAFCFCYFIPIAPPEIILAVVCILHVLICMLQKAL